MGSETIRDVVIRVRMEMVDDKPLKAGVDKVRADTAASGGSASKQKTSAVSEEVQKLRIAADLEKARLGVTRSQLDIESKRLTVRKAELEIDRQSMKIQEKMVAVQEAALRGSGGAGGSSSGAKAKGGGGLLSMLGGAMGTAGAIGSGVLGGAGLALAAPGILSYLSDKVAGGIGTWHDTTRSGVTPWRTEGTPQNSYGKMVNAFDNFQGQQGRYRDKIYGAPDPGPKYLYEEERAARQKIIDALQKEVSYRQAAIGARDTIGSSNFQREHLGMDRFRQFERASVSANAYQRDQAEKISSLLPKVGGYGGLSREGLEAAKSNPLHAPLYEQWQDDQYRKGASTKQAASNAMILSNTGFKDRYDAALKATAVDLKLDQKMTVNISIQAMDKIVDELKVKLLPEIIKMNQMVIAQAKEGLSASLTAINLGGGMGPIGDKR